MERLLNFDVQLEFDSVLLAINIFILFVVLSYLLFNPVRDLLRKRLEKIRQDRETATRNKTEAAKLKEEYDDKLKEVNKEAEEILSAARKKALNTENSIIEEAKEEASLIIERANHEVALEKKRAMDDMKQEIITIASLMAGKVVSASIDTKVQDALFEETMKEMSDKTWLS